jgi:putative aldouronate transport system substrate-binding protein
MYEFGQDGFFLDLTELIEEYGVNYKEHFSNLTKEEQDEITRKGTDPASGGFYGMPILTTKLIDNLQSLMFINQTWLDKVGMQAPTNVNELYEVLKAFATKDPNGNGIADELPILGKTSGSTDLCCYIINAYVYYDSLHNFNVTDGKVWAPFTTNEYREALKFMNKLCAEGLLPDLNFTISSVSEFIPLITPATGTALTGIFCGHPLSYSDPSSNLLEE